MNAMRTNHVWVMQHGLTLVEVMISMTIGLILLVALGTMLSTSLRNFKVNDDFSRLQENGVFALHAIGKDVRMAGFYGRIGVGSAGDVRMADTNQDGAPDADPIDAAAGTDCGAAWAIDAARPIFGYDATLSPADAHAAMPCIATDNFIPNSPILVLRGAEGMRVNVPENGVLYVQSTPASGILFEGSQFTAVPATAPWKLIDEEGAAKIYPYQARAYYLRPCSRPTGDGGTACTAADDDGHPIPTLVRQELRGLDMVEQAVAEGVERMVISYGLDDATVANRNGMPNRYVAIPPNPADWSRVVSIRVALLLRSPVPDRNYRDDGKQYDLGDGAFTFACPADPVPADADCRYHRHVFAQTFQVRNLSQRWEK